MQHLDDALIAEWVDGAIAADSPHYAAIGSHVDECEECRARVEEERALAGHVRQLLGVAVPPERVPAFEEVLHRAGTAPGRATPPRLSWRRLAWAATVVVAGGVGWYARGIVIRAGSEPGQAPSTAVAMRDQAAAGMVGESDHPAEQPPVDATTSRLEVAAVDAAGRGGAASEAPQTGTGEEGRREEVAEAEAVRERVVARRDAAPAAAPAVAEPRPLSQAPVAAENELRMQKTAAITWLTTTQADAERVLGRQLLVVPELPIAVVEVSTDSGAIRLQQDLGNGRVLELVQSRSRAADEAVGQVLGGVVATEPLARRTEPPAAVETLVIDGIRVVARAAVSGDSLRVLVGRLGG